MELDGRKIGLSEYKIFHSRLNLAILIAKANRFNLV